MQPGPTHSVLRLVRDADSVSPGRDARRPSVRAEGDRVGTESAALSPQTLRQRLSSGRVQPVSTQAQAERAEVMSIGQVIRRHGASSGATPAAGPAQVSGARSARASTHASLVLDTGDHLPMSFQGGSIAGAASPSGPRAARREVARENLLASALPAMDVRWMLALKVQHALEGGVAAMLRPEVRRRLIDDAGSMGLRPFDANLIIAIVQDRARSSLPIGGPETDARLAMVGAPEVPSATTQNARAFHMLMLGASLGLLVAAYVVNWILTAR
jgi:hypothetical protein